MKRRELLQGTGILLAGGILDPGNALTSRTTGAAALKACDTASLSTPGIWAEPNINLAKLWWPRQRNEHVPVGWKDHYFRFNVLYNGTVMCDPCPHWCFRPHAQRWKQDSFQLTFTPTKKGALPLLPEDKTQMWRIDTGVGIQGWELNHETPVLWTEWRCQEGLVLRQEIFAHAKNTAEVLSGLEPLYAWIRLSVAHVDELHAIERLAMAIQLSKVYLFHSGQYVYEDSISLDADPKLAPYPRSLRSQSFAEDDKTVMHLVEPDDTIRMMVLTHEPDTVRFSETEPGSHIYSLSIDLAGKPGYHIDLLVPMFPARTDELDAERALGFDAVLRQCDDYWAKAPATAAHIQVPEDHINRVVKQSLKLAEIITEKDYQNGECTFLTGSWGYDQLWSTPTSMLSHMFLDLLGYHDCVAKHTDLFRDEQGTVKPPGAAYDLHPGYFSTPKHLTAFDWITDHGAILHQVSTHALLSGDHAFIDKWTDPIVKGCEFLKDACNKINHDGVPGLLPPAVATDELIETVTIWSMAWNYKGLTTAVRFLERIHHPRAVEFEGFAAKFKSTFVQAFREQTAGAPEWTDRSGKKHRKAPTSLSRKPMPYHRFSEAGYLDTGPLVLVWAGLMDANDEIMRSTVQFFREGPNTKLYGYRPDSMDRPILIHEISSCEPCYSWNIFHSWQLGDRVHFLEGLYSLFVGALSTQTFISCEERDSMQGNLFATPLAFALARLAVIDDELKQGELHLLRLCPQAWISSDQETLFENMPTVYGPLDLRFKLSGDRQTLAVRFEERWREKPTRVVLHTPAQSRLSKVSVNGKLYPGEKEIDLVHI